jgi:hypothetical protein
MIISSTLVTIGYVREVRYMYCFAVPTSGDCLKVGIV